MVATIHRKKKKVVAMVRKAIANIGLEIILSITRWRKKLLWLIVLSSILSFSGKGSLFFLFFVGVVG